LINDKVIGDEPKSSDLGVRKSRLNSLFSSRHIAVNGSLAKNNDDLSEESQTPLGPEVFKPFWKAAILRHL
jgi:hypothetical protein